MPAGSTPRRSSRSKFPRAVSQIRTSVPLSDVVAMCDPDAVHESVDRGCVCARMMGERKTWVGLGVDGAGAGEGVGVCGSEEEGEGRGG